MVGPVLWCPTTRTRPGALSKKGGGSAREKWRALRAKREGKTAAQMRPGEVERRGRFPSGMVRKFGPPDPPTPLPPRGQGEPREGKSARRPGEPPKPSVYVCVKPGAPGARTELRLYRCAPEVVRSLLVPAVLRCPLLLSRRLAPCQKMV